MNLSGRFAASSSSRGALGKEVLPCGDCQGLSYKERWHPEGMTERLDKSDAKMR